jgi:hypothetical protein
MVLAARLTDGRRAPGVCHAAAIDEMEELFRNKILRLPHEMRNCRITENLAALAAANMRISSFNVAARSAGDAGHLRWTRIR